jgi:hypothetical protein
MYGRLFWSKNFHAWGGRSQRVEPEYLTDSERQHVRDLGKSAMLLSPASLETLQAVAENVLYQQMLASAERVRGDTRRAAQEIERIVASKGS